MFQQIYPSLSFFQTSYLNSKTNDKIFYVSLSLPYLRCAPRIMDGARYENPRFPIDDDSAVIITYISRTIMQGVKDIKSIGGPSTSNGTKWNAKHKKAQHTNK